MSTNGSRKQHIAIVAITRKGIALGQHLKEKLPNSHLYLPQKFAECKKSDKHLFLSPVKEVITEIFTQYQYLVLIMATGIAVRSVATALKSKYTDPGVIVLDDAGLFSVSLLSGHLGGANELAKKIASLISAQPVITTASEVSKTIAVDLLGKEFGWEIEDKANVKAASAALVNGEPVGIYQDAGERNWWPKTKSLPYNVRIFTTIDTLSQSKPKTGLIITDRIIKTQHQSLSPECTVIYRPKSLVIGIGCNRGTPCAEIEEAVSQAFLRHKLSIKSIRNVATISIKKNEDGLLEFAQRYHLPIEYFDKEALRTVRFPSSPSAAALKHLGIAAVAESAALLSSQRDSLVLPKVSYHGTVTLAVARLLTNGNDEKRGKLFLVGIGPGSREHMSFKAVQALNSSEVIIGYKTYIKLIEPYLHEKEVIAGGMGEEVKRAKTAVTLAKKGINVSLVSGGDTGIYGMAGLVGEILRYQPPDELDIEIIPGIPSLISSASLLGSPITGDFAAISLSDYLVPWDDIIQRLRLAVEGDFVIVLHNPNGGSRQYQLSEARELILENRSASVPVGIVTNAYRQKQEVIITDLEHMMDHEIGMDTTIIIGNSTTFTHYGRMVTPRGYETKYDLKSELLPND